MKIYTKSDKEIVDIYNGFIEKSLIVDPHYQRRKIWNDEDKVRFIETILLNYVVPEVFFWQAERDPDTGLALTHIVDGQQRITTIVEFINDELILEEKYLIDKDIKSKYANKSFNQLPEKTKNDFWGYTITVILIDKECPLSTVKMLFYRLNLTDYSLNEQERRNSLDSAFGDKCVALSDLDFWVRVKAFSSRDTKRMLDVKFCCSIYILANEFIVNQTDDKIINDYYDDYKESFDPDNALFDKISKAMGVIDSLNDKVTLPFISKKTQLYTLFSIIMKMLEDNEAITAEFLSKFKQFVEIYSLFRNTYVYDSNNHDALDLFNKIKQYKLSSSEGVNKLVNRMLRYELLYEFCNSKKDYSLAIAELRESFEKQRTAAKDDSFEADDLSEDELAYQNLV